MDMLAVMAHCRSLPSAHDELKVEWNGVWVCRVGTKIFAFMAKDRGITLKCDPIWAQLLRQTYEAVEPGYHMNKKHWITVRLNGTIPDDEIREMIDHAYHRVVASLTRRERAALGLGVNGGGPGSVATREGGGLPCS